MGPGPDQGGPGGRDYWAFGLRWRTCFALPCLPAAGTGPADLTVEPLPGLLAPATSLGAPLHADPFQQVWRLAASSWVVQYTWRGHLARFELHLGEGRIRVRASAPEHVPQVLLGPMASFILQGRKALALHGTALARDGASFLVMGRSGAGKSTTAAALLGAGCRLLLDDLAAPGMAGRASLQPGCLRLRIGPDAAAALGFQADLPWVFEPGLGLGAKRFLDPPELPGPGPVPLEALFFLLPRDAALARPVIARLGQRDAALHLLANLRPGIPAGAVDPGEQLRACAELARTCPAFTLRAPQRLELLPDLARAGAGRTPLEFATLAREPSPDRGLTAAVITLTI